ncbi:hypothetical protein AGDE_15135 [Angomonas deanei]|uniref:Uncharacterized protein n=1 Tax=Angomonas deanei TaxID=59799 RepID=A0A7G2CDR2_9TRYP|nr:hypothetical protein AGDE_15135 [Angomonas deanei]CAD2217535.1 hypothetical protein, conserved [Angomonas deanei]|eukprot:EPY19640.1 hypothetical protein AGDE_15135 [Angomonas deanei]
MCAKEGAKLCVDPAAELSKYATDVNVTHNAAKLTETDSSEKFSLLYDMALKSISFFDAADREEGKAASLIVVVGPDWTVLNRFCRLVPHGTYHCVRLVPGETAEDVFLRLAKGTLVAEEGAGKRCILFTTADLAQTILPASLDVGLLIDLAHDTERPVDPSTMSDSYRTGYANFVTLRNRRRGCKMLLQLIPKKILHHAQNRKVQVEHCLFSLPLERCVQLYGVLTALQTAQPSADHSSVAQRIAPLVKDIFIGVGGVANSKYEELRRLMIQVEQQLEAGGVLTARGKGHATTTPFTPIGVALLTLQLPLTISRLMLYSGVFDCTPVVCTLAALCVIGDIGISKVEEEEKWEEYCEGRKFFSSESNSDMVSSFNLFKMYLDTKANNEGDAFITEGCLSREKLTRVSQLQAEVYAFMLRTGLAVPSTPEEASLFQVVNEASVTAFEAKVREFPDKVMLQPSVVSCLSAAFYPNCAVLYGDGSAAIVDGLHHVPEAAKPVSFPRFGAFDANSVVQAASGGNPFLFLSKRVAITEQGALTRVSALNCGIPLESATVVVASGVGEEKPKRPPTRCRGWSSQLTTAWRSTTRARQLPPPAQLPPSSVALLPYDTIHSPNVVYTTDRSLSFTMRATTARWLLLFKKVHATLSGYAREPWPFERGCTRKGTARCVVLVGETTPGRD